MLRGVRVVGVGGGGTLREACGVMCFLGGLGSLVRGEAVGDVGRGLLRWRVCCGGCFALLWCLRRLLAFDRERDMDGHWLRLA